MTSLQVIEHKAIAFIHTHTHTQQTSQTYVSLPVFLISKIRLLLMVDLLNSETNRLALWVFVIKSCLTVYIF